MQLSSKPQQPLSKVVCHLSHVESSYPLNRPAIMHNCGRLPLCLRQDNVHKVLACRHHPDALKIVGRHTACVTKFTSPSLIPLPLIPSKCWNTILRMCPSIKSPRDDRGMQRLGLALSLDLKVCSDEGDAAVFDRLAQSTPSNHHPQGVQCQSFNAPFLHSSPKVAPLGT